MTDTTTAIARGETPIADGLERRNHHPRHPIGDVAQAADFTAFRLAELAHNPLIAAIDAAGLGHVLGDDEITIILRVTEAFEKAHQAAPQVMP